MPDRTWSASQYKLARACRRRWAWVYLHGEREPGATGTVLGKDAHWVWERWLTVAEAPNQNAALAAGERYRAACGEKIERDRSGDDEHEDTLEASQRLLLGGKLFASKQATELWRRRLRQMTTGEVQDEWVQRWREHEALVGNYEERLRRVCEAALPHLPAPRSCGLEVEGAFKFEIGGVKWRGYKDLTWWDAATRVVHDHKTTSAEKWVPEEDEHRADPQRNLYARHEFAKYPHLRALETHWHYTTTDVAPRTKKLHLTILRDEAQHQVDEVMNGLARELNQVPDDVDPNALPLPEDLEVCKSYGRACPFEKRCQKSAVDKLRAAWGRALKKHGGQDMGQGNFFARMRAQDSKAETNGAAAKVDAKVKEVASTPLKNGAADVRSDTATVEADARAAALKLQATGLYTTEEEVIDVLVQKFVGLGREGLKRALAPLAGVETSEVAVQEPERPTSKKPTLRDKLKAMKAPEEPAADNAIDAEIEADAASEPEQLKEKPTRARAKRVERAEQVELDSTITVKDISEAPVITPGEAAFTAILSAIIKAAPTASPADLCSLAQAYELLAR